MTNPRETGRVPDEHLVAYLDGELNTKEHAALAAQIAVDAVLQSRVLLLSAGNRPFKHALAPLLDQAPEARLKAMLSNLHAGERRNRTPVWTAIAAIAAAIILFLAGLAVDRVFPNLDWAFGDLSSVTNQNHDDDDWRQAVAEYLSLYSADTIASIPDDNVMRDRELQVLRAKLEVDLSAHRLAIQDLSFKRAQLFMYDGKALGQVVYLDPDSGPVALCLIRSETNSSPMSRERRENFNIVFWTQGGHNFMMIGRALPDRLDTLAKEVSARLPG